MSIDLSNLTPEEKRELLAVLQAKHQKERENRLALYKPYPKQIEFHAAGADHRERLFSAGNQLGKTVSGAAELAMHATGVYPKDWPGRRYPYAIRSMAGSESAELTKKGIQRLLLGSPEEREQWGTGYLPKAAIRSTSLRPGVPDAVASIVVRHSCGEDSVIQLQSYDQGRTKWQADTLDYVWFDEEPPLDLYTEGLTRTNATQGIVALTFTPLLGMSAVVRRFMQERPAGTHITQMTIADALHYTPEQRESIIAAYPEHEREARANGVPMLGEGAVFPVTESGIKVNAFAIPAHWPKIIGIDFGWDHPTAAVWMAWDRDTDTLYVYDVYVQKKKSVPENAMVIRAKGDWYPVAWPHDGLQHDKGSGEQLMQQYKDQGLNMLKDRATFENGSNGVEAGIAEMLDRMQTGRFKVFSHLNVWFDEFRQYHRKDGRLVKEFDDAISATRYAIMMKRFARTKDEATAVKAQKMQRHIHAPSFGVLDTEVGY